MKNRSGARVMLRLVGLVRPLTGYMLLAILMGLVGHLCATAITVLGSMAALEILGDTGSGLGVFFLLMAICALLRGLLRYGEQSCNHYIAFKLLALIRDKVFGALRRLCPAKLEGRDRGDLISVITSDIELLEVFYAHTISPVCIALVYCLTMCLVIGSYHPALALLALVAYVTVGVAIPLAASRRSGDLGYRFRTGAGELSGFVLDSLRGLSETIQYGGGQDRLRQMNARTEQLSREEERLKRTAGWGGAVTNTAILFFGLAMLGLSALLYQKQAVDFSGVLIPTIAMMGSFGPCVALASLGTTLQNTFAAGDRVLHILEEEPETADITGREKTTFAGAEAKGVTFSYGGETILSQVSLAIPRGSVVGISGRSGSGKSTLLKLLMRFWTVGEGRVEISGRNVEDINTHDLRNMESFVTQQTHLFRGTIRENLCIAKENATHEELIAACQKASVHDFIQSLPQGYDTPVGELGDTLSGGERQRIGLARAFLHDAPFILLDEPTSNLDSLNEAVILRAIQQKRDGRTVVLVSHRKSTMAIADQVCTIDNGRIS